MYRDFVLPRLCDMAMRNPHLERYRERVAGGATGRVLEIGAGSGLNLRHYTQADRIVALEPVPRLVGMARRAAAGLGPRATFVEGSAEAIPLADGSVDTVVVTWSLCTIPDPAAALRDVRRVLRPGGTLRFVEHGRAEDPKVRWWQDMLTPAWRRISGGCHLNRPIATLIQDAGFALEQLETGYAPGPKFATWFYEGCARR